MTLYKRFEISWMERRGLSDKMIREIERTRSELNELGEVNEFI